MEKGRKLTSSLSDLFHRSCGHGSAAAHGHLHSGDDSPELGEDDVWSLIDGSTPDDRAHQHERRVKGFSGSEWATRAAVEIGAREERHVVGGLSLAFECHASSSPRILHQYHHREAMGPPRGGEEMATSAPVKVPIWSEIYRVDSVELWNESDGESEVVPPHVYLARGRRAGATSVFEGVGRTLKGRDLRRARDAVWSQTGFDG